MLRFFFVVFGSRAGEEAKSGFLRRRGEVAAGVGGGGGWGWRDKSETRETLPIQRASVYIFLSGALRRSRVRSSVRPEI